MATLKTSQGLDAELRECIAQDPLAALAAISQLKAAVSEREQEAVYPALDDHT